MSEIELAAAGLAEKEVKAGIVEAAIVLDHLPHHLVGIVRVVLRDEDLTDHLLLIRVVDGAHPWRHPKKRGLERETHQFSLIIAQAFVQGRR